MIMLWSTSSLELFPHTSRPIVFIGNSHLQVKYRNLQHQCCNISEIRFVDTTISPSNRCVADDARYQVCALLCRLPFIATMKSSCSMEEAWQVPPRMLILLGHRCFLSISVGHAIYRFNLYARYCGMRLVVQGGFQQRPVKA